jgi:phosphoglycerate dehydrogenase-like enzyme
VADGAPVVVNLIAPRPPVPVLPPDALDTLRAAGWTVVDRPLPRGVASADLPGLIGPEASAVLASWGVPTFTPEVHAALPKLRFIGYCAGSVKTVVTPATFAAGVTVVSAAPVIATAVAEYCLAALLWTLRDLGHIAETLRVLRGREGWIRPAESRSLWGRRVGIVSASSTARAFLRLLAPFGCHVVVYDPYLDEEGARALGVRRGSLEEVCAQSVVSVHAPALPATRGLIGRDQLRRIPDGGIFLNSARASVVDYEALVEELRTGRFRAILDVFPEEPLPADSPLYGLPNVLLTPHTAGYSADVYARIGREVVADLLRWQAGQPPRMAVDARRWEILA